jgi:nucleotide-binding universal stress UspA family protein
VSFTVVVLAVAAGWLAIGLLLSLIMGRRGHDAFSWLVLGSLFGPLGAIFAVEARGEERTRPQIVAAPGSFAAGPVDVLVGFDGSPEGRAAFDAALALLGPRVGRVTLATVVPYDGGADNERLAKAALERAGAATGRSSRLEVLHGRPSEALMERAVAEGYDLLVIGTRGAGAADALLGSTAADVARSAPVPVLLMGAPEVRRGQAPSARS